jgi:Domain of unknown function (DUF4440)
MLVRPTGKKLSKRQVLDDLEKASLTFLSISSEEELVRIYGTTALLTAESRTHTRRGANEAGSHVPLVATYLIDGSTLRLVHFQRTNLPMESPSR